MPFGAVLRELKRSSSKDNPSTTSLKTPVNSNDVKSATDENQTTVKSQESSLLSEALRSAASNGDFDRVKELCKNNVSIDADGEGRTALHYSSLNGHLQIVKELIASGAKVNVRDSSGFSPLHLAASEGNVEIVNLLLKSGSLIDVQDDLQGNTALHEAAWKGFSQTIELLMKNKANAYIKNKGGFSALHLSCQQGHNGSARVLLISRCKPDLKNNYGDTPLHTAARYGHAGVARILISAFCQVSPVNKNGDTPLHITAAMGRRKLTKILLESGCNPTLKNMQGETAMDIALRKSLKEVQEIIANPPPLRDTRSSSKTRLTTGKKREKESSLEGSKGSEGNHKSRKDRSQQKKSKLGSSKSVQFLGESSSLNHQRRGQLSGLMEELSHDSPYGCPQSPDLSEFPGLKIDSLPKDPLKKGEQYYIDLAGNIRKGPTNRITTCNCKPLFEKVERKMDSDKQEIKDHIDCRHDHLKEKICHLEKKTTDMSETFKEKIACERAECMTRSLRNSLKDKIEFERKQLIQVEQLKGHMKSWLDSKLKISCSSSSNGIASHNNTNDNRTAASSSTTGTSSVGRRLLPPLQLKDHLIRHSSSSTLNLDLLQPKPHIHNHQSLPYLRNQTTLTTQQNGSGEQQQLSSNYAVISRGSKTMTTSDVSNATSNNNRSYSSSCVDQRRTSSETRQLLGSSDHCKRLSTVDDTTNQEKDSGQESPTTTSARHQSHGRMLSGSYSTSLSSLSVRSRSDSNLVSSSQKTRADTLDEDSEEENDESEDEESEEEEDDEKEKDKEGSGNEDEVSRMSNSHDLHNSRNKANEVTHSSNQQESDILLPDRKPLVRFAPASSPLKFHPQMSQHQHQTDKHSSLQESRSIAGMDHHQRAINYHQEGSASSVPTQVTTSSSSTSSSNLPQNSFLRSGPSFAGGRGVSNTGPLLFQHQQQPNQVRSYTYSHMNPSQHQVFSNNNMSYIPHQQQSQQHLLYSNASSIAAVSPQTFASQYNPTVNRSHAHQLPIQAVQQQQHLQNNHYHQQPHAQYTHQLPNSSKVMMMSRGQTSLSASLPSGHFANNYGNYTGNTRINGIASMVGQNNGMMQVVNNNNSRMNGTAVAGPQSDITLKIPAPDLLESNNNGATANGGLHSSNSTTTLGSSSLPSMQSQSQQQYSPPASNDDEHVSDLMKSLRCNGHPSVSWNHHQQTTSGMRDSPFTDSSGYRTKFSPSPREQTSMNNMSGSNGSTTNNSPGSGHHSVTSSNYTAQQHLTSSLV